jgi:hypothetical protein
MPRLITAFAIAPLAPLVPAVLAFMAGLISKNDIGFLVFAAISYGYPAMILFGIPLFIASRRRRWLMLWQIVLGGAIIGGVVPGLILGTLVYLSAGVSGNALRAVLSFVVLGAVWGGLSGWVFWLIAVRGRRGGPVEAT